MRGLNQRVMLLPGLILVASAVFYLIGGLMSLVGTIKVILAAFRLSILWGLAYLFLPFASLIFWIRHWPEAREGVILSFKGLGIALIAGLGFFIAFPMLPKNAQANFVKSISRSKNTAHVASSPESLPLEQPLQTAREDVKNATELTASLETKANQTYGELMEKRKTLDTKNATAVHAFNEAAAVYASVKTRLAGQQKELARLKKQEELLEIQATAAAEKRESGVVMYSTSWCPACKAAKQYFTQRNIPFEEIDVEHSPDGAAEFRRLGGSGVPMIVIRGNKMTGFDAAWVEQRLKN